MRGLWLAKGAARLRDDLPRPEAAPGLTRVRVHRVGICATDLALSRGYLAFEGTPGHEFVGTALDGPLAGQRVVGEINAGCGACPECVRGDPRHCAERVTLGIAGLPGALAEELQLPSGNVLPVPDGVPDDLAVFTEPLAAALAVLEALPATFRAGDRVLVAGDGRLGLLIAHALARHGARVEVAGRHPERQALLPEGARLLTGLLEEGAAPPRERPFDLVVEATGSGEVLPRALSLVRPRGTLVLKTTTERPVTIDLAPLVIDEIRLVGSRCGRFAPALEWLAADPPPVAAMIGARFSLEEAAQALRRAEEGDCLKVLVDVLAR